MSSTIGLTARHLLSCRTLSATRIYSTVNVHETDINSEIADRTKGDTSAKSFQVFSSPKAVVPAFDFSRRLGSMVSETIYGLWFERGYMKEGLLRGANEGTSLVGLHFANGNWDALNDIACTFLVESLQIKRDKIEDNVLARLRFSSQDIVCSFLYSTLISGRNILKLSESGNLGIYFTVVSFIRSNPSVPNGISVSEAVGKYRKDIFVSNVTFARTLNPLGPWKVSSVNYFTL